MNCRENKYGFSLIELLTVVAIIGILAAIILANRNSLIAHARVTTAANLIVNAGKETRQRAVSVGLLQSNLSYPSYGIYFTSNPPNNDKIYIYSDCVDDDNGDKKTDKNDYFAFNPLDANDCTNSKNKLVEEKPLGQSVRIKSISIEKPNTTGTSFDSTSEQSASIEYIRPEPTTWISDSSNQVIQSARLIITLEDTGNLKSKTIIFSNSGLIYAK